MTHRTAVLSDFSAYLESEYPQGKGHLDAARAEALEDRASRLAVFPHSVVLQAAYPELDFANRWCWSHFGPPHGPCHDKYSEYRTCELDQPHTHEGTWTTHWLAKTDYDFGFNEWCFLESAQLELFVSFVPELSWGEHYPK